MNNFKTEGIKIEKCPDQLVAIYSREKGLRTVERQNTDDYIKENNDVIVVVNMKPFME